MVLAKFVLKSVLRATRVTHVCRVKIENVDPIVTSPVVTTAMMALTVPLTQWDIEIMSLRQQRWTIKVSSETYPALNLL